MAGRGMSGFDALPLPRKLELLRRVADAALPRYAETAGGSVDLVNLSENATYRVDAPRSGGWALRVHREGYHSKNAIASELAWVQALRRESGVITPTPLAGRDGELIQTVSADGIGPRHVVLFEWEAGSEPPEAELLGPFKILGRIAAKMHAHVRGWRRPRGFERLTWDFDGAFGTHAHWGRWQDGMAMDPAKLDLFGRVLALIQKRLASFGRGGDRFGLVHCDMRLANLLIDGETVKVIDFDDCGFGWNLYDCATALSFLEDRAEVPDLVDAWVRGYRSAAELPVADEAEIPSFIMFRRLLILAWIGSHAETDLAQSLGAAYTEGIVPLAETYLAKLG